ncbi:MAG: fibronectin type III domain-containing protein, partial [bacterium]
SRYHKSKFFCSTCHDVSNPALANLGQSGSEPLTTEKDPAFSYFHVERTWSEFMSSAYGQQGGTETNTEFQEQGAPDITSAAKCQDCHMRDVVGVGCNKAGVPLRPDESIAHPNSGLPLHDMTGGNLWISRILASLDMNGPVYEPENVRILDKGPAVLTLDLSQGETPKINGAALKAGSDRAKQQLLLAATIKNPSYNSESGVLSFTIQNNSAHKLISGFPEGRRMFINIKAFNSQDELIYEANPYDYSIGTLKGLSHSHSSPPLETNEVYIDELVYEVHPKSSLTGEDETFHFVLADGRYKDNRIPPKGFDVTEAVRRLCEPVWHGESAPGYFTTGEYAGGYDDISINIAAGAKYIVVALYYQGTSREYIEFLRDEINGVQNPTLPGTPSNNYIIKNDPFFSQLAAWGDVIWELWEYNHGLGATQPINGPVDGIVPFIMTQALIGTAGCSAPTPTLLTVTPDDKQAIITWQETSGGITGYRLYYDQSGKAQLIADLQAPASSYIDTGLTNGQEYCYKLTSYNTDCESGFSSILCATPNNQGQTTDPAGVDSMITGSYSGGGKTKTFTSSISFNAGASIVIRAHVIDKITGTPLANATVDIAIDGPETTTLTSGPSDSNGIAEATWNTQAPNKRGQGGTAPGAYTASTIDVKVSGYHWDSVTTSTSFKIQ